MINFPKEMWKNKYDAIFFLPGEKDDSVHVEQQVYKKPGKKLDGSILGDTYHIILFKIDDGDGGIEGLDDFEAILLDPLVYISQLIPQHWYGVVAKKTTTSKRFIKKTLDGLKKA